MSQATKCKGLHVSRFVYTSPVLQRTTSTSRCQGFVLNVGKSCWHLKAPARKVVPATLQHTSAKINPVSRKPVANPPDKSNDAFATGTFSSRTLPGCAVLQGPVLTARTRPLRYSNVPCKPVIAVDQPHRLIYVSSKLPWWNMKI